MATDKNVNYTVNAKDKTKAGLASAQRNLKKTTREAEGLAGRFRSVARATVIMEGPLGGTAGRLSAIATMLHSTNAGMIAMGVGLAGMTAAVYQTIQRFSDFERQTFKINQLLKQTGHASGLTGDQIESMAQRLGKATLESADGVREASAVLLSFKSVAGSTFERTISLATDLSALTSQDLKSSVIQLGKALEDPATGMSALRRSGVSFTNAQKDMIVAMNEAGDVAGSQRKILELLEGQLGGTGAAAGKGLAGAIDLVSHNWNNLLENFGNAGVGNVAIDFLNRMARGLDKVNLKLFGEKDLNKRFNALLEERGDVIAKINRLDEDASNRTRRNLNRDKKVLEEQMTEVSRLIAEREKNEYNAYTASRRAIDAAKEARKEEAEYEAQKRANAEAEKAREKSKGEAENFGNKLIEEQQKFENSLLEKSHVEDIYLEDRLAKIEEHRQNKFITDEQAHQQEQIAFQLHNAKITEIHRTEADKRTEADAKAAKEKKRAIRSSLTDIASLMSSGSKKMFRIGQAAAIANALIRTHEAVALTMAKTPYPWNIPLAAAQTVAGMARVNAIRSQQISGAREFGGSVIGGRTYLVGERGPELFTAPNSGTIVNNNQITNQTAGARTFNFYYSFPDVIDGESVKRVLTTAGSKAAEAIVELLNNEGITI